MMHAHVYLLNEGVDVWRPVQIEPAGNGLYRIVGEEPEDEKWELKPGSLVKLVEKQLAEGPALIVTAAPAAEAEAAEAARRLAALGGSDPNATAAPRRRFW